MTKNVRFNVRVSPQVREEFQAAARLRGATASSLVHQFMVKVIREEKERNPKEFARALAEVQAKGAQNLKVSLRGS